MSDRTIERFYDAVPRIPSPAQLWPPLSVSVSAVYVFFLLAALPPIIVDYWFLESLGQARVFWTNLTAQLILFGLGVVLFTLALALPLRVYAASLLLRKAGVPLGLWVGVLAGWYWSRKYPAYLLAMYGGTFGESDPLFGHDVGFYVFVLPAIRVTIAIVAYLGGAAAVASFVARADRLVAEGPLRDRALPIPAKLGLLVTNGLNLAMFLLGMALVWLTFLTRYDLLTKDNSASGVRAGADYLDAAGFFSTLNMIYVSTLVELVVVLLVGYSLLRIKQYGSRLAAAAAEGHETVAQVPGLRLPVRIAATMVALDLVFFLGVVLREHLFVRPNEPTIQLPYIERHMAATLKGYRLVEMESIDWEPADRPLAAAEILKSQTIQNAPILPGWVSRLEEPPDVQHFERVEATASTTVYGPMLQIYEQEQQLRPYYRFLSVDAVRYDVDGQKRMFVSAVRELPSLGFAGPKEWLRHWGSAALMYTHGFGLVMSPVNRITEEGSPDYVLRDIPPTAAHAAFEAEPRIYFGEGARDDYILTNVRYLEEFDHATRQFRSSFVYPPDLRSGIPVDSLLKRVVLAFYTRDFSELLFSRFIDPAQTRIHLYRTPLQRVQRIAPFLFLDSNVYAFIADSKTLWMINALTTTDGYPYSFREVLGDKADERAVAEFPERIINYAEDSVKVTIDAYTGAVTLYQQTQDPIVEAWRRIYPKLFEPADAMPPAVRDQRTYPLQWFHIQFDDIYKRYHQRHPIEFYNAEDLWDDADEVLGSIGRGLTEFGTTDQMTFSYEGYNILVDPADLPGEPKVGRPGELQFALLMPFTPEGARNLRSLVVVLQDGENYGRLVNYRVPQGVFIPGPEQADALIDDDGQVNQQITLWVRHGSEVVRGHTLLLPVAGDLLYIEPLWISSLQNPLPQIKLFSVVYRGRTTMSTSIMEAIRLLDDSEADERKANELPWFEQQKQVKVIDESPRS